MIMKCVLRLIYQCVWCVSVCVFGVVVGVCVCVCVCDGREREMCICCFKPPLWPILFWLSVGAADNKRFCEMHLQWNPSKGKIYKVT